VLGDDEMRASYQRYVGTKKPSWLRLQILSSHRPAMRYLATHLGYLADDVSSISGTAGNNALTPEVDTSDVGAIVEPKDGSSLIQRNVFGEADDVPVECSADKVELPLRQHLGAHNVIWGLHTSENIKVFAGSKPMAMISFALLLQ